MSKEELLRPRDKGQETLKHIKCRKLAFFSHRMRNEKYRLLQLIIQDKTKVKRSPRKRRKC